MTQNLPCYIVLFNLTLIHCLQGNRQAGGRGKKAHRGKGKGRGGRGQQPQQPQKRQYEDMDGDVEMKTRGERGGKRYQQRKRLAMGCNDVEMQEVGAACTAMAAEQQNAILKFC